MPRKKKNITPNLPDKSETISLEKKKAFQRSKQRVKEEGITLYVHQSTIWSDTFFISPSDSHPHSNLIEQFDP